MRRMFVMSLILVPLVLPIWLAKKANPRHALKRMVYIYSIYLVLWTVLVPRLYFLFPGE